MGQSGFLVCADITGYTSYLSSSELEHASGTLGDLLSLLLDETRLPLRLSRVEGDAIISYSISDETPDPAILLDRLEATYVAFRRALEQMVLNTTCTCNACANIGSLDLKVVVHHGPFVVQRLGTQDELMGPEVNLMFRMVKNDIRRALGTPGYLAFTDTAIQELGLASPDLVRHVEHDVERGPVTLHVRDMAPVWEEGRAKHRVEVDRPVVELSEDFAAPIDVVWNIVTRPEHRRRILGADRMDTEVSGSGRLGRDTVYICHHGKSRTTQTIVDWDPPFRYVVHSTIPIGGLTQLTEFALHAIDDATTRLHYRSGAPRGSRVLSTVMRLPGKLIMTVGARKGLAAIGEMVDEHNTRSTD